MKKVLLLFVFCCLRFQMYSQTDTVSQSDTTIYTYCMIVGETKFMSNNINVTIDDGSDNDSLFDPKFNYLKDKNGKKISFETNSSNSNNAQYSSLSFDQLKELLSNQQVILNEVSYNLFDFLLEYGDEIALDGMYANTIEQGKALSLLVITKIITSIIGRHIFTEIGHDFYLKAKLNKMQNNT